MPDADQPEYLSGDLATHDVFAGEPALAPQETVTLGKPAGDIEQGADRVLGDGLRVSAGLVHGQHARFRAGLEVDRVIPGAGRGHAKQVGATLEQGRRGEPLMRQFILGRGNLIRVRLGKFRPVDVLASVQVARP